MPKNDPANLTNEQIAQGVRNLVNDGTRLTQANANLRSAADSLRSKLSLAEKKAKDAKSGFERRIAELTRRCIDRNEQIVDLSAKLDALLTMDTEMVAQDMPKDKRQAALRAHERLTK